MQVLQVHESERRRRPKGAPAFDRAQQLMQLCAAMLVHVCAGVAPTPPTPPLIHMGPCMTPQTSLSAPEPPLALLVASHVADHPRLSALVRCLAAIRGQVPAMHAAVFLSWSAATSSLRDAVRHTIERAAIPLLRAFERVEPLTQFEHYALLAQTAAGTLGDETWVCFSDDDDLMHPCR